MHQTLTTIQESLKQVIAQIESTIPNEEPLGIAQNNWSFPGLTRSELMGEAQSIIDLIESQGTDDVGDHSVRLQDYVRRLQFLRQSTLTQILGSANHAVPAYLFTLQGLRKALAPVLDQDDHAKAAMALKRITRQIRGMEARLKGLEPRTTPLATMVDRIEQAYSAADQLPADLEALSEARREMADLTKEAVRDQSDLLKIREQADELDKQLSQSADDAKAVLERCETAYSAATSVGLAAAFNERSNALSWSMWVWVGGLVISLAVGSYFGSGQFRALSELLKIPDASTSVILLNLLFSVLSIGAPVWFAWLSTKQIGQRFRLAEDYAFKASVSRAYEGFRREAARFDKDMEAKLLASALTRLDELPLRLVETASHGSPWHELASSDVVRQAMKVVPGFTEQVKGLASKTIVAVAPSVKTQPSSKPALASERPVANLSPGSD